MEDASTRKSGRSRQPSKRLSDFQLLSTFEGLDNSDGGDSPIVDAGQEADDGNASDDFEAPQDGDEDSAEDDAISQAELEAEIEAEPNPEEGDDDDLVEDDDVIIPPNITYSSQGVPLRTLPPAHNKTARHGRSLADPKTRGSKEALRLYLFGPAEEDQQPALQSMYRWRHEPVLPSHRPDLSGSGGYHPSFYHKDADRDREMDSDWLWYDDEGGSKVLRERQTVEKISVGAGAEYVKASNAEIEVVMGPVGYQKSYDIGPLSVMELEEPFVPDNGSQPNVKRRSGWLLNAGGPLQNLAWVPNQRGRKQYLAITTVAKHMNDAQKTESAFRPQPFTKSAIQIWEFTASEASFIDNDQQPQLRQVICTDFGDVGSLKWCIAARKEESEDYRGKHLGLLAGVWRDGSVRVLDITLPPIEHPTEYLQVTSTAFMAKPPDTVFASLCWLSSHSLAAGTATGHVAIFDLLPSLSPDEPSGPATPILYTAVQSTYITSITSCYPSRPHMLVTSAMSGSLSLTDLTRVTTPYPGFTPSNTVYSPRARLGRSAVTWHDWSQMVLSVDDGATLQGLPLRRFFGYTALSRFKSITGVLAVSACHPCVAAGGVGGEVTFTNPMRRALSAKEPMWNLRWFEHVWRRRVMPVPIPRPDEEGSGRGQGQTTLEPADAAAASQDLNSVAAQGHAAPSAEVDAEGARGTHSAPVVGVDTAMPDAPSLSEPPEDGIDKRGDGLVRLVEGFKAESIVLLKPSLEKKNGFAAGSYTTIHESQTAVTTAAWNPNLHVGGWIAAGMASGLIRIEDVGMER